MNRVNSDIFKNNTISELKKKLSVDTDILYRDLFENPVDYEMTQANKNK